jgi:hypothetical protein
MGPKRARAPLGSRPRRSSRGLAQFARYIAELDLVTDPEKLQRVRWQPDEE